jgi:hypothetical protein
MLAPPRPLALSDDQLDTVMRAARVLAPADRDAFLKDVARALDGREIGDGLVRRICTEAQRLYWRAPDVETRGSGAVSKYSR